MADLLKFFIVGFAILGCAPDVGDCSRYENQGDSCSAYVPSSKITDTSTSAPDTKATTICGNDDCEGAETPANCPADCPAKCGNGKCENGESVWTCQKDCNTCGDGICFGAETPVNCANDCAAKAVCGDGKCNGAETNATCVKDCPAKCGNGVCETGETPAKCIADCNKSGPYVINAAAGTVLDTRTGLTWQRLTDGKDHNWQAAKDYCAALTLSGAGWRLSTKDELEWLVDKSHSPTIDPIAFPNTPGIRFWTSTPSEPSSPYPWLVNFGDGASDYLVGVAVFCRVRCVR